MKYYKLLMILSIIGFFTSCKKFVEIESPKNSLVPESVFKSDDLATSAMVGIYRQLENSDYASGDAKSISTICGLTADELIGYSNDLKLIYQNQIIPENTYLSGIWNIPYARIYGVNSILEGLEADNGVTPPVKLRLKGEALFVRAFTYFYLVNLYGPVPIYLTSDYLNNSKSVRNSVDEVYAQIISDLKQAETLLDYAYITKERVRPNRSAVDALLARVFLFMGDWANAEKYSEMVLSQTSLYKLVALDQVFLSNSSEAIWQLAPPLNTNTKSGGFLILTAAPINVSLSGSFAKTDLFIPQLN